MQGHGEGNGNPLQYSCLENPVDGRAWWAAVHGVAGSWTRLSDFTFTFHFHGLEKEMATHSSVLAWRIPGKGEPGGLPSMGSHRVGHDWSDLAAAALQGQRILRKVMQYLSRWGHCHWFNLHLKETSPLRYCCNPQRAWFIWPCCTACGILVPQPGVEPQLSVVKVWSPNHWTTREFSKRDIFEEFC